MPLSNFSLLQSVWGQTAVITHIEFLQTRHGNRSSWRALVIARGGQMLFANIEGEPRRWNRLDEAVEELGAIMPLRVEMKVIRAPARGELMQPTVKKSTAPPC
jgi:hypothetical protein